ncbi:MAG: hypothetical protein K0Q79_825 [Flavipsychrobacter sp.]|nr:hypothetical protein [Flavipsychrobacter sp.]
MKGNKDVDVALDCYDNDGLYKAFYMYMKRDLNPSQYSWSRYITIDKYVDNKRNWKVVFR